MTGEVLAPRRLLGEGDPALGEVEVPVEHRVLAGHRGGGRIVEDEDAALQLPALVAVVAPLLDRVAEHCAAVELALDRRLEGEGARPLLPHALLFVLFAALLGLDQHPRLDRALGDLAQRLFAADCGDVAAEHRLRRLRRALIARRLGLLWRDLEAADGGREGEGEGEATHFCAKAAAWRGSGAAGVQTRHAPGECRRRAFRSTTGGADSCYPRALWPSRIPRAGSVRVLFAGGGAEVRTGEDEPRWRGPDRGPGAEEDHPAQECAAGPAWRSCAGSSWSLAAPGPANAKGRGQGAADQRGGPRRRRASPSPRWPREILAATRSGRGWSAVSVRRS